MRILIIDDELFACKSLEAIIESTNFPVISIDYVHNSEEATKFLTENPVDLIFLDIKLGKNTGFDILEAKIIAPNTTIVIASAYDSYALKSYGYDVSNYILKPFQQDDVMECLIRANKKMQKAKAAPKPLENLYFISNHGGGVMLHKKDIIFIEAKGAYCEIHTSNEQTLLVSKNLKKIELELNYEAILRINRFFLVNVNHIVNYNNKDLVLTLSNNKQIGLSNASALYEFFGS